MRAARREGIPMQFGSELRLTRDGEIRVSNPNSNWSRAKRSPMRC
jgi:hypothetical protein